MTKKFLAVSFLSLMLVACGGGNSSGNSGSGELELSQRDKELANGNPNVAAEILVQKAILQEAKNEKLTEEEQIVFETIMEEVSFEQILQSVKEKIEKNKLFSIIMSLKIRGLITETNGAKYIRIV